MTEIESQRVTWEEGGGGGNSTSEDKKKSLLLAKWNLCNVTHLNTRSPRKEMMIS